MLGFATVRFNADGRTHGRGRRCHRRRRHLRQAQRCTFSKQCPELKVVMLEAQAVGGTWDGSATPGCAPTRTCTPWVSPLSPGPPPRQLPRAHHSQLLHETMDEYALAGLVRFHHKVLGADWDSGSKRFRSGHTPRQVRYRNPRLHVRWLLPLRPGLRGAHPRARFLCWPRVHPQFWPEDLDYAVSGSLSSGVAPRP